jgi:hypothetical protein
MVALARSFNDAAREFLAQLIEVDSLGHASVVILRLGDAVGKELSQPFDVLSGKIGRVQFQFFHSTVPKDFWTKYVRFSVPHYFTLLDCQIQVRLSLPNQLVQCGTGAARR